MLICGRCQRIHNPEDGAVESCRDRRFCDVCQAPFVTPRGNDAGPENTNMSCMPPPGIVFGNINNWAGEFNNE